MTRFTLLVALCIPLSTACSPSKEPKSQPAAPLPGKPAVQPGAPAATPSPGGSRIVDAEGITLEFMGDGRIGMKGTDQWGGKIDVTYESDVYLRNAMPVLARSLKPHQAEAVQKALGPAPAAAAVSTPPAKPDTKTPRAPPGSRPGR